MLFPNERRAMIQNFFNFIYDRQEVWYKRNVLKLAAPWSNDEILKSYKFCNVYRELDGGTLEISKYLQKTDISPEMKLFNIVAYRFFNRRDTIEKLFGGLLDPEDFNIVEYEKRFDEIKKEESIFSNAYLISSHPYNASYRAKDKHVQVLLMLDDLRKNISAFVQELHRSSPEEGLRVVERHVAMAGPFLSGQILLDATYAGDIVRYTGDDFLVVGPGALWGLKLIFGGSLNKKQAEEKCRYLHGIQKEEFARLRKCRGKDWFAVRWDKLGYPNAPYLCLHDVQNSLCEFRKYWRLKNGAKAKKRYFK